MDSGNEAGWEQAETTSLRSYAAEPRKDWGAFTGRKHEPQAWVAETILTGNLRGLFTHRFQCLCAIRTHHHLFQ